jgi:hypothetical protein
MPKDDPPSKPGAAEREAKLAQALRANLRRRKGAPAPPLAREPATKRTTDE